MARWNAFLTSLSTRGGAIFLLMMINAVGVGVTVLLIFKGYFVTALAATISTVLGNYNGALLMALKGSSDSTAIVSGPGGSATASTAPVTPTEGTQAIVTAPAVKS
jgi:hypothetical protein